MPQKLNIPNLQDLPIGARFRLDTKGSSMQWLIHPGDELLAERINPKQLSFGDIAIFYSQDYQNFVTHRFFFKKKKNGKTFFIFKGDNLNCFDSPVSVEDIVGKVIAIEKKTRQIDLNSNKGKMLNWLFFFVSLGSCFLNSLISARIKIKNFLRDFVLKTNNIKMFNYLYRLYYSAAIQSFKLIYANFRQVESIYLRRQLAKGSWHPGASDIDLSVLIKPTTVNEETKFLKTFWKCYEWLKYIFPFLGEVEIFTTGELENWQLVKGVRTQETLGWKRIYGPEVRNSLRSNANLGILKLNHLNEAIQSFWTLTLEVSAKKERPLYPHEYRKFFNLTVDILKFMEKIECEDVADERQKFIFSFIAQQKGSLMAQALGHFTDKIFSNAAEIDHKLLMSIYAHLLCYLDKRVAEVIPKLLSYLPQNLRADFTIIALKEKIEIYEEKNKIIWKGSVEQFLQSHKEDILTVISNSHVFTAHCVVVLKDNLPQGKIKDIIEAAFITLLNKEVTIVTKNILQSVCYSLFLESPFNYWQLTEQAEVDFGVKPKDYLQRPPEHLLSILFKESIGQLNLCYRMFPINRTPPYLLYHSLDHIMRIRLALEKKIITCSLKDALDEYRKNFKDVNEKAIEKLQNYLCLNERQLHQFSRQAFFYENFAFIREGMQRLNNLVVSFLANNSKAEEGAFLKDIKTIKNAKVRCIRPWSWLFIENNEIKFCCWSKQVLGDLASINSLADFWNNATAQYVRQKMLEGETKDICLSSCPILNAKDDNFANFEKWKENAPDAEIIINNHIKEGNIRIDSQPFCLACVIDHVCNLRCKMCFIFENQGYVIFDNFYHLVNELSASLKLVYLIGGEPLFSPRSLKFIHNCIEKKYKFKFGFITNLTVLDKKLLSEIALDGFCVSIDGATKETYERIRKGAVWERVIKNLHSLILLREEKNEPFEIKVTFLVMTSNFKEIPQAIELFEPLGVQLEFPPIIQVAGDKENIFERAEYYDKFKQVIAEARRKTSQDTVLNSLNILEQILKRGQATFCSIKRKEKKENCYAKNCSRSN